MRGSAKAGLGWWLAKVATILVAVASASTAAEGDDVGGDSLGAAGDSAVVVDQPLSSDSLEVEPEAVALAREEVAKLRERAEGIRRQAAAAALSQPASRPIDW